MKPGLVNIDDAFIEALYLTIQLMTVYLNDAAVIGDSRKKTEARQRLQIKLVKAVELIKLWQAGQLTERLQTRIIGSLPMNDKIAKYALTVTLIHLLREGIHTVEGQPVSKKYTPTRDKLILLGRQMETYITSARIKTDVPLQNVV